MAPATTTAIPSSRFNAATVMLWALQVCSIALFLMAGISTLAGADSMVHTFAAIGMPTVTGSIPSLRRGGR